MQVPQFKGKLRAQTLIAPDAYLEYLRSRQLYPSVPAPLAVIICYHVGLFNYVCNHHKTTQGDKFSKFLHFLDETEGKVAITRFGIGAPAAAILAEELIAWGVKSFISVGTAGTLQSHIKIGDIVLCERAIRDEGTSFHYLEPAKYAEPCKTLTDNLETQLKNQNLKYVRGTSWTTDAPYRETLDEARNYQAEGVAAVDMEAAALFAVGTFRKVHVAAMFSISDSLAGLKWEPHFHSRETQQGLEQLFQAALRAL